MCIDRSLGSLERLTTVVSREARDLFIDQQQEHTCVLWTNTSQGEHDGFFAERTHLQSMKKEPEKNPVLGCSESDGKMILALCSI